jgi:hypothetical protein
MNEKTEVYRAINSWVPLQYSVHSIPVYPGTAASSVHNIPAHASCHNALLLCPTALIPAGLGKGLGLFPAYNGLVNFYYKHPSLRDKQK